MECGASAAAFTYYVLSTCLLSRNFNPKLLCLRGVLPFHPGIWASPCVISGSRPDLLAAFRPFGTVGNSSFHSMRSECAVFLFRISGKAVGSGHEQPFPLETQ